MAGSIRDVGLGYYKPFGTNKEWFGCSAVPEIEGGGKGKVI